MSINLFYPATLLPHKNHHFLCDKEIIEFLENENIKIILTIEKKDLKIESDSFSFIGRVSHKTCLSIMRESSAIIFLSSYESLGLPILEASFNKKSIIVPDLNYSREIIGNKGYFLKYPLNKDNTLNVLKKFKNDYIKGINKIAKLKSKNIVSSNKLIQIFMEELNL